MDVPTRCENAAMADTRDTPPKVRYDPVAEARAVAVERARRDRALTPAERLERLRRLCASLARMQRDPS